jgi:hypothetical protein
MTPDMTSMIAMSSSTSRRSIAFTSLPIPSAEAIAASPEIEMV